MKVHAFVKFWATRCGITLTPGRETKIGLTYLWHEVTCKRCLANKDKP